MKRYFATLATIALLAGCAGGGGLSSLAPGALPPVKASAAPIITPSTSAPTGAPTSVPTTSPTNVPTTAPTAAPTSAPTSAPTAVPTATPTSAPTATPTATPTASPTPYGPVILSPDPMIFATTAMQTLLASEVGWSGPFVLTGWTCQTVLLQQYAGYSIPAFGLQFNPAALGTCAITVTGAPGHSATDVVTVSGSIVFPIQ